MFLRLTQDYKPTDNVITERINEIIKQKFIYRIKRFNTGQYSVIKKDLSTQFSKSQTHKPYYGSLRGKLFKA